MNLLLDSDTIIEILRGNPRVRAASQAVPGSDRVGVSSIAAAELHYGAARSRDPVGGAEDVAAFLSGVMVLPINEAIAVRFGTLKAGLQAIGQIIGDFDLLIAATALVHGYTVVTHNTRHFVRIPGLAVVDWLA